MTETSETTAEVSSSPTITGPELLEAAHQADNEGYQDEPSAQQESVQTESSGDRAPEASGEAEVDKSTNLAEPSAEQRARDEKGRFLPKSEQETAPETPQESKYAKAKAEGERQKSLLANFEQEKQQHRAWLESEKQRLAQEKAQIEKFKAIPRSQDGRPYDFNAKQYADAADDFYGRGMKALQDGDPEAARDSFQKAQEAAMASQNVWQAEQQMQQEHFTKQHYAAWNQDMERTLQQDPSLFYNKDNPTPMNTAISQFLEWRARPNDSRPLLEMIPNGFSIATELARMKVAADESSARLERATKAEAELENERKRTGIRPSPSTGMPPAKTLDNMTDNEQRSFLIDQIRQADSF